MIYLNDGLSSIITFYEFVYAFTLYLFAVRPELWMSHFSDVREGISSNITLKPYKVSCESSIFISVTAV